MTHIPKNWSEITLERYVSLLEMGEDAEPLVRIAAISGCEIEELESMIATDFNAAVADMDFLSEVPDVQPQQTLLGYKLRDLDKLTVGEFADLEKRQKPEHLPTHLAFIYPEDLKYVPSGRMLHATKFETVPMSQALPALRHYQKWREKVFASYPALFASEEKSEPVEGETPAERKRREREDAAERAKADRWGYFGMIARLAGQDPLQFEAATELNIIFSLNFLSYQKENNIQ